jgi:hypothetical protein
MEEGGNEPGIRSPPITCCLGSSRFVAVLAHPLSGVTVLREAAFAEDAEPGSLAELGRLFGMMAAEDLVECDDEVLSGLCEADDGVDGFFRVFDSLMQSQRGDRSGRHRVVQLRDSRHDQHSETKQG